MGDGPVPPSDPSRISVFDRLSHLDNDVADNIPMGSENLVREKLNFAKAVGQASDTILNFYPLEDKKQVSVKIPIEMAKEAAKAYNSVLYGYFLGPRISFPMVKNYVKLAWGKYGFKDAMLNENGIFFFKFNDIGGCDQVIEAGPLMIRGIPLFVHRWDPSKGLRKPVHTSCPLWVKLHNIPLVAFNKEGVSRIASVLGVPKQMDSCTAAMCEKAWGRPGFAKVLVEVWAVGDLKKQIEVEIPDRNGGVADNVQIQVEYLWEPVQCSHCQVFGHKSSSCPKSVIKGKHVEGRKDAEGFVRVEKKQWRAKTGGNAKNFVPRQNKVMERQVSMPEVVGASTSGKDVMDDCNKGISLDPSKQPGRYEMNKGSGTLSIGVDSGSSSTQSSHSTNSTTQATPLIDSVVKNFRLVWRGEIRDPPLAANKFGVLEKFRDVELHGGESHVARDSFENVSSFIFGRWSWISNQVECDSGTRIIIAWDSRILDVMLLEVHNQFLNCKIILRDNQEAFFCSFVYGANVCNARRQLWSGLRKFKVLIGGQPWAIMGDFNTMLFPHDGFGGSSRRNADMADFFACIEDVEVFDLNYTGVHYSWNQKPNASGGILPKLDRIMANSEFTSKCQDITVHFFPAGLSDHSPGVLSFKGGARKRRYGFKFDNFLTEHSDFLQIVHEEWSKYIEGSFMFRVTSHLKALKVPFRKQRNSYGNLGQRVAFLKTELDRIQIDVDNDPSNADLGRDLGDIRLSYQLACWDEECAAKQRAKVKWLNEGDSNTKFFHRVIKERHHSNSIMSVCNSRGIYVSGDDVPKEFVDYFKSFFGVRNVSTNPVMANISFPRKLILSEALDMIRPVTNEEIKNAMFSIGNHKAPGSDGFSSKNFKVSWGIIGRDVEIAVHNFFYRGNLPKELNHTLICLIPKSANASKVTDYRPIACCTVLYKCISKFIANRMKGCLDSLIDKSQSAFIPGRRITDNILMAHELVTGYQSLVGPPRCAFKIDIKKAYDTVDWNFLIVMLQGLGFHPVMVNWIREMVSTTSFSLAINGNSYGFFQGGRSLRQGDPLSPYLFTIVMEGFSMILRQCIQEASNFGYHRGCEDLNITHLCFADDLFVFTKGDVQSVE
ncbi:uncharacterized protein LOC112504288, partial [Cynara cardunculus var. scolymus]|uniref:uncharacterized protein LOC112504288 n=1 Tax=Cynara cardunculus var. scolymus TaxID=59895 RepID=UPI000D62FDA9